MTKVVLDTNVLLDYCGCGRNVGDQKSATELIGYLWERGDVFCMTPHQVKDLQYLITSLFKKELRREKGSVSEADARIIETTVLGLMEHVLEIVTVVAEGSGECEMARMLLSTHADYEDNLIAAVALRIGADCIVTRDAKFAAHAPVKCATPAECLQFLQDGVFQ